MPKRFSFSRAHRLTRSAEFQRVRIEGCKLRGDSLTIAHLDAGDSSPPRAGFVTSRRVGNAVLRNRARRRLREIFRKHQHQIRAGFWVVTIVSARAARASFAMLEDEWLRLMKRASILAP